MHEIHMVHDLFKDLLSRVQESQARQVTKVYLRMGEWTEINEDILRFFFKAQGYGTVLEHAELCIEKSPNRELRVLSFDCD